MTFDFSSCDDSEAELEATIAVWMFSDHSLKQKIRIGFAQDRMGGGVVPSLSNRS